MTTLKPDRNIVLLIVKELLNLSFNVCFCASFCHVFPLSRAKRKRAFKREQNDDSDHPAHAQYII